MSKSSPGYVVFPPSLNRRAFLAQAAAATASSALWSCGGGGNSSAPAPTPTTTPTPGPPLTIVSVSPANPTALNPMTVQLSGFDPTKAFTVALSGQTQTPIRVNSNGAIIIAAPANVDVAAGATASFSTMLTISQSGTAASSTILINDMPQLSDLGVPLGTISRAFLNYQAIILGQSINAQQAISLLPKAGNLNNSTLLANLKTQLLNVIKARNDIDRIMTNNGLSIPVGTGPGGMPLSFDSTSVTTMDRVIAQSLLTSTNNGTLLPQLIRTRNSRHKQAPAVQPLAAGNGTAFWNGLTVAINTESGAASYLANQQTLNDSNSSFLDQYLSNLSAYSSYLTLGATVVGLAAGAASLPALAGFAGLVATGATIAGLLAGTAAIGNDAYNIYTSVAGLVNKDPNATVAGVGKAFASLATDGVTTYLNAEGMGGVNGVSSGVGQAFNSIFTELYTATADSASISTAALMASTGNLLVQEALSADSNTAESSIQSVSPNDFGLVTGMCAIANSEGPILSGLTGVSIGDANGSAPDTLTSIAAPDGSYSLVVPLDSPSLTYNLVNVAAFDPVDLYDPSSNTLTILSSSIFDISGVNPNSPIPGPPLLGACDDTDAGDPDGDDPDCD